jgi:hypothetical protein
LSNYAPKGFRGKFNAQIFFSNPNAPKLEKAAQSFQIPEITTSAARPYCDSFLSRCSASIRHIALPVAEGFCTKSKILATNNTNNTNKI